MRIRDTAGARTRSANTKASILRRSKRRFDPLAGFRVVRGSAIQRFTVVAARTRTHYAAGACTQGGEVSLRHYADTQRFSDSAIQRSDRWSTPRGDAVRCGCSHAEGRPLWSPLQDVLHRPRPGNSFPGGLQWCAPNSQEPRLFAAGAPVSRPITFSPARLLAYSISIRSTVICAL